MAFVKKTIVAGVAVGMVMNAVADAAAQTVLPSITVTEHKKKRAATAKPARVARASRPSRPSNAGRTPRAENRDVAGALPVPALASDSGAGEGLAQGAVSPAVAAARASQAAASEARARILPQGPANGTTITERAVNALPAGNNTSFDQVLLRLPGVTQDSSGSGDFHIRNEHANAQYRINGIFLPEGVSGFSQVLDSTFIRSMTLLDGALPAQYGLRTAGIIDITTRNGSDAPGTTVTMFGGSHGTLIPTLTTMGVSGRWDYFVTGRFTKNSIGIENPEPTHEPLHDDTRQGRYFASVSGQLEDGSHLTFMSGASTSHFQIPNSPGVPPAFTAFGVSDFDSAALNENQVEQSIFNVVAWQKSIGPLDTQLSYFQRYSTLHYLPDPLGDLVFNGVASHVYRSDLVNGVQSDSAYRTSARNTLRFGFTADVERAASINSNTVLPLDAAGNPIDMPFTLADAERKTGSIGGLYVQDEYRLTPQLAVTGGLRYDYMAQYVTTDQLSPRLGVVFKPTEATTIHAGYARYFTPPELALSAPSPVGAYDNTTLAAAQDLSSPVRPERSHYFDAGVTHRLLPGLDVGIDGYYKIAKNLLDDGQFGQALVLTAFNYDHAYNQGVEFKANYANGGFRAYGNLAIAKQRAKEVTSNQYLFGADELAYIANNYIYTDHDQFVTASGGASYKINHTTFSADVIYGSGLRDGFANIGTVSPHAAVNLGVAQDFFLSANPTKPTTLRFTVINVADHPYAIRDGSGIGVFQAQYGERRGYYASLSQTF